METRDVRISRGGQISLPAEIRRRWASDTLIVEDLGNRVVIRPMPADPIGAAVGAFRSPGLTSDQARTMIRMEETEAEQSKHNPQQ